MGTVTAPAKYSLFDKMIGHSAVMREILEPIENAASSLLEPVILVTGESGVGKECVVRAIHEASQRKEGPLVIVNCSAVSPGLFESEFFGHVNGSFTGVRGDRKGYFETANRGTLFLDEIGDLPPDGQAKLLRALQDHTFMPVGSSTSKSVDFRLVAATNRDLSADVEVGKFRTDLYYRISTMEAHLPPLRERKEDIPELAMHFLEGFSQKARKTIPGFDDAVMECFNRQCWKGNIRQLEHAIEHAVVVCPDNTSIEIAHLPNDIRPIANTIIVPATFGAKDAVARHRPDGPLKSPNEIEREHLLAALEENDRDFQKTANALHISKNALLRSLVRLKVGVPTHGDKGVVPPQELREPPNPYPFNFFAPDGSAKSLDQTTNEIAQVVVQFALVASGGDKTDAAKKLGTTFNTLKGYELVGGTESPQPSGANSLPESLYMFNPFTPDGRRKSLRESQEEIGHEATRRSLERNGNVQKFAATELRASRKSIRIYQSYTVNADTGPA